MTRLIDAMSRATGAVGVLRNRRNGSFSAWWVAFLGALGGLVSLVFFFPDPYLRLLAFLPDGLLVTFEITCSAIALALLLGLVVGLGRISRNQIINAAAATYVEVVRGIPLLVQLLGVYYALGRFVQVSDLAAVIIAIAFCYGANMGEAFRTGIEAVERGQTEAARSLGFNSGQTMTYIVLPQAWRTVLPLVGRECLALLKDSSLVSILAVADVMHRAHEFAAESSAQFETYLMVALVYLLLTLILSRLVSLMEARLNHRVRP